MVYFFQRFNDAVVIASRIDVEPFDEAERALVWDHRLLLSSCVSALPAFLTQSVPWLVFLFFFFLFKEALM
jgi:hypothetical protein